MKIKRPNFGVRIFPPLTLFYIPYAFLRLATKRARRPQWLQSYVDFIKTPILRGLRVWTSYLGFKVYMTLKDLDLSPVVFSPAYEPAEKYLISLIKPEVAIDVGAHLGSFTLLLAKYARVVVAVEPDPRTVGILARAVSANGLNNVIIFPYACSSSDGKELSLKLKRGGCSHIAQSPGGVAVKTVRVDTIVEALRLERVDFLKVDVEGHELEVLRGAQNTLNKHRPILLVEVFPENAEEVDRNLRMIRYRLARVLARYSFKGARRGVAEYQNRLYLPQELPFNQLQGPHVVYPSAVHEVEQGVS